jgi:hypothetical protein
MLAELNGGPAGLGGRWRHTCPSGMGDVIVVCRGQELQYVQ